MRAITIVMGILLMGTGVWSFANSGVSFLALAFAIGLVMIADGTVEGMTYIYSRGGNRQDNNIWMLADSIVTFVLGILAQRAACRRGCGSLCIRNVDAVFRYTQTGNSA